MALTGVMARGVPGLDEREDWPFPADAGRGALLPLPPSWFGAALLLPFDGVLERDGALEGVVGRLLRPRVGAVSSSLSDSALGTSSSSSAEGSGFSDTSRGWRPSLSRRSTRSSRVL